VLVSADKLSSSTSNEEAGIRSDELIITRASVPRGSKSKLESPLLEGCAECLADVLDVEAVPLASSKLPIDYFHQVYLRLAGSEVEGAEIELALLLGPLPELGSGMYEIEKLNLTPDDISALTTPKKAVRVYRQRIVGRADGTLSVVVVAPEDQSIHGLFNITLRTAPTLHDQYCALTRTGRYIGVWIKPTSSVRVYRDGYLRAHVQRLRDGLGWTIRDLPAMMEATTDLVSSTTGRRLAPEFVGTVAEVLCALSESRSGAALYFVASRPAFQAIRETLIANCDDETVGLANPESQRTLLMNRLKRDGATVVAVEEAMIVASGAYFVGPGGRRGTAKFIAGNAERPNEVATVLVSHDGPIYMAGVRRRGEAPSFWEFDEPRYL
jgi:hypothetical protein